MRIVSTRPSQVARVYVSPSSLFLLVQTVNRNAACCASISAQLTCRTTIFSPDQPRVRLCLLSAAPHFFPHTCCSAGNTIRVSFLKIFGLCESCKNHCLLLIKKIQHSPKWSCAKSLNVFLITDMHCPFSFGYCLHQLVSNGVCVLFGAGQIQNSNVVCRDGSNELHVLSLL